MGNGRYRKREKRGGAEFMFSQVAVLFQSMKAILKSWHKIN
jgi:hypothetical protein